MRVVINCQIDIFVLQNHHVFLIHQLSLDHFLDSPLIHSRCEFLNPKQLQANKNKAMRKLNADKKRMKLHEENAAIRTALCDAGIKQEDLERDCGLGSCQPRACHGCANIKTFIFTLCVFSTLSGMMIPGYLNSVITTIETRFQIGSSTSGELSTGLHPRKSKNTNI